MSQPTLHTRTSSFFTSVQLEWVGSNLSIFTVCSPLISLLSLQIKYRGQCCSPVHRSVNLQPAVTAFISRHENGTTKRTALLQEKGSGRSLMDRLCALFNVNTSTPQGGSEYWRKGEKTCVPVKLLYGFTCSQSILQTKCSFRKHLQDKSKTAVLLPRAARLHVRCMTHLRLQCVLLCAYKRWVMWNWNHLVFSSPQWTIITPTITTTHTHTHTRTHTHTHSYHHLIPLS